MDIKQTKCKAKPFGNPSAAMSFSTVANFDLFLITPRPYLNLSREVSLQYPATHRSAFFRCEPLYEMLGRRWETESSDLD